MNRLLSTDAVFSIDRSQLLPLPNDLVTLVQSLAEPQPCGAERRTAQRFPVSIRVPAIPLDQQLRACGRPFVALSVNISAGGLALVYTRPVPAAHLLITLETENHGALRILMKLLRCRRASRFFELCGKFEARVAD